MQRNHQALILGAIAVFGAALTQGETTTFANTLTATEFYNQYSSDPSAIPLPSCATSTSSLTQSEIQAIVLEHNRARKDADRFVTAGLPPLPAMQWSCDAAAIAQEWADQTQGNQGHSSAEWRQTKYSERTGKQGDAASLGENLGWAASSNAEGLRPLVSSVTSWDNERNNYNHDTKACSGVCGHYTQVVWRESTEIGCGVQRGSRVMGGRTWNHGYFLSCTYHHAGNINGDHPLIVHPDWYYSE